MSRAYLKSFKDAYSKTKKVELIKYENIKINLEYSSYEIILSKLDKYITTSDVIIKETNFLDKVELNLNINTQLLEEIERVIDF